MTFWPRFILAILATWRVTHLLVNEDGPFDLIVRFRARLGSGLFGQLMDCFYCLSLWVSAPLAFFVAETALDRFVAWLALSGGACLLERLGQQFEKGGEYGMLRSEEGGVEARYYAEDGRRDRSRGA